MPVKQLILFLILSAFAAAPSLRAATYTAASCSASDVQKAINSAKDGDTVLLPGSTCSADAPATWSSTVTVSKGIYFNGQGSHINFSVGSGAQLVVNIDSAHGTLVENFYFANGYTNGGCPIMIGYGAGDAPSRFTANTFTDTSNSGPVTELCTNGIGAALLVDHNTFKVLNGASETIHIFGGSAGHDTWTDSLTPGSPMMAYFEANTFNDTNTGSSSAAAAQSEEAYTGAEFVFRHNSLYGEMNDVHGGDGSRWAEFYENTYYLSSHFPLPNYAQLRGGSGLYYNNHVSGSACCQDPWPTLTVGPDCPGSSDVCSGTWPVAKQVGRGINEITYSPMYLWGNDSNIQNRIGAAPNQSLANVGTAPTDTSSCLVHSGNVCDAVATSSKPSLLRCQTSADVAAGCPVKYTYAAFTYPYPLASDGLPDPKGSSSSSPASGSGLQGEVVPK